jgi:general secretion pathway protein B
MSYILDALKRAERERKQGKVSVLDEIPLGTANAEPTRRLPAGWLPVVVIVVLAALLAYALLTRRQHKDTVAAIAAPAIPAQAMTPNAAPAQPRLAATTPPDGGVQQAPPPAQAATIEDGAKIATLDDVYGEPPPPPGEQSGQQPDQAPAPGQQMRPPPGPPPSEGSWQPGRPQRPPTVTIPVQDAANARNAIAVPAPGNNATANNTVAATAPETPDGAASPAQAPAPDQAPQQDQGDQGQQDQGQQRQLREMPENYRANFPSFAVDVHAYNSNPQRRFVLIGGKRYHEGDTMAEGPRIIGIVPEGMVLDWQGQQVLYAIAH